MPGILIKNGTVVDPAKKYSGKLDVYIEDGKIASLSPEGLLLPGEDTEVIDATGMLVAPGLVDVHVHFRDPGFTAKEDIETGARAAAKGGFTSVVLMANTKPTVDTVETLSYVIHKGQTTGIHVYTCANVTMGMKGETLTDMETLAKAGAVGFTDDGIPLMKEEIVVEAMKKAGELNMPISFHEEDPSLIENNGIHRGKASEFFGIGGSPREAEISLIERDIRLMEGTGAQVDIQHISTAEGVELVRQAKAKGLSIHAEATPHHFTLTQEAAIEHGTLAKMNPPLREEKDRQAIIEGIKDGTIDMIATDHAPHTAEEKAKEITQAPSGIIGLETALSLGLSELVAPGHLTMEELMHRMSTAPAALYHLDAGYLDENGPADLILIDPEKEYVYAKEDIASKACNTPFIGRRMKGKVVATICGGAVVYREN